MTILSFEEFFQAENVRLARALYLLTGSAAGRRAHPGGHGARVRAVGPRRRQMDSEGYLFRTALNLHRSRLPPRLATRAPAHPPAHTLPGPGRGGSEPGQSRRALASIPTGQREAVVLVEWLGMEQEEAATALGIKPGSVRARLSAPRRTCDGCWRMRMPGAPRPPRPASLGLRTASRSCSSGCSTAAVARTDPPGGDHAGRPRDRRSGARGAAPSDLLRIGSRNRPPKPLPGHLGQHRLPGHANDDHTSLPRRAASR